MSSKKPTRKAASAKKTRGARRSAQPARGRKAVTKTEPVVPADSGKLTFNHSMIYVKDVERALGFYRDLLGFKLIEDFLHQGKPVYARLRAPGGEGTIALHHAEAGISLTSDGVRLYFEVRDLDDFCGKLRKKGFYINQMPRMMPWGWRHAYLNDPDGHEISLYWAGENRMKKTMLKAIEKAAEHKPRRAS